MCGEYFDVEEMYFVSHVKHFTYYDSVLCHTCTSQLVGIIASEKMKFDYDFSDFVSPPSDTIKDIMSTQLHLPEDVINTFYEIYGEIPITREIAERLSKILGGDPKFWIMREASYRNDIESVIEDITRARVFWTSYTDVLNREVVGDEIICPVCGGLATWDVEEDGEDCSNCIFKCINCGWWTYVE